MSYRHFVGHLGIWVHNGPCDKAEANKDQSLDRSGGSNPGTEKPRFISQPDGRVVDTHATPQGSYKQPNGGRTDILQAEDHGAGLSHTHDPKVNVNPETGESFVNGLMKPGRPVSAVDVENIVSGDAPLANPKGR